MVEKKLPCSAEKLEEIAREFGTPFHLYDEAGMRANARSLKAAFDWAPGFKEYFAVKAAPTPALMRVLADEGFGMDCSSLAELVLSERVGVRGEDIMFTSNDTPAEDYRKACQQGAVVNLDDLTHIDYLNQHCGMPELICFRYNPGPARGGGNVIIGRPEEAKYGLTREQLFEGYAKARELGARRFGLHTMVASNELHREFFVETARMLFELARDLREQLDIHCEFVNLGGGIGIPYRPEEDPIDLAALGREIAAAYDEMVRPAGLDPLKIFMENGRMVTGPYGWLVARAIHGKSIYREYVGLDACMADLMRPGMYGAYHHITVAGKEAAAPAKVYDVVGSLCENNDKFAIQRQLPEVAIGDLVAIHDAGAHGRSMGFNYNGKLRSKELLLHEDGSVQRIRRAETLEDYFATLEF